MSRVHATRLLPQVSAANAKVRFRDGPQLSKTILPVQFRYGLPPKGNHGDLFVFGVQSGRVQRVAGPVCCQHQGQPVESHYCYIEQRVVSHGTDKIQSQGTPSVQSHRRISVRHQDEDTHVRPRSYAPSHR